MFCGYAAELNGRNIKINKKNRLPDIVGALKYMLGKNSFGIYGEGETSMLELCSKIEKKSSFMDISGLVYLDKKKVIHFNDPVCQVDFKNYPVLTLDKLPVNKKYLTPVPIAPIHSSRGCYWKKCAFCDHAEVLSSNFREMSIDIMIQSIKNYKNKYGIKYFFFCDESMPPSMLKKLSKNLISSGINIQFGTMIRIEKSLEKIIPLASRAGLKFLSFGMESACDRVINKTDKGFNMEVANNIFNLCYDNKVLLHLNIIFSFPTESHSEAKKTMNFLINNAEKILCIRANNWMLTPGSLIRKNPARFGIEIKNHQDLLNPSSYIQGGINGKEAWNYIIELYKHEKLSKLMIANGKIEEFHLLRHLFCEEQIQNSQ